MPRTSPVQRSLKYLRQEGWTCCSVEKWLPPRGTMKFGRRIDALGFGDLLACHSHRHRFTYNEGEIALVQTTTLANMNAHKAKILALPEFAKWKAANGLVLLHGWAKRGPRGKRKLWMLREEAL
jgi:hypothetical protein